MITRKEYMDNGTKIFQQYFETSRKDYEEKSSENSRQYWNQFVNDSIINIVRSSIGGDNIKNSVDQHFNDIPLQKWDVLAPSINQCVSRKLLKDTGESLALSTSVCIAKAAARKIKESN